MSVKKNTKILLILYLAIALGLSVLDSCSPAAIEATNGNPILSEAVLAQHDSMPLQTPAIKAYQKQIKHTLEQAVPIMPLADNNLDDRQKYVQQVVLNDPQIKQYAFDPKTKQALRMEIFGVIPARQSDYAGLAPCADGSCYRVELYNYALNFSVMALVHANSSKILKIGELPGSQPDIPPHLKQLALHIATQSPEVYAALGYKPDANAALMADTKTALNRTRCERSRHLCVAPTFVKDEKALWAIVDLTDLRLVGVRWTNVGDAGPRTTERRLQNDGMTECYCKKINQIDRDGWQMNYILTSSDGLRISEVDYNNQRVILNAKVVDWHVNYSNTDGFGYSDAIGCPYFSQAAVIAVEPPRVLDLIENGDTVGFVLSQKYYSEGWPQPCNYNYEQRYEFYRDGKFRSAIGSLGRGCGNDGTYRPVTRIAFADKYSFAEWGGNEWSTWQNEKWQLQQPTTAYTPEGYQYKLTNQQGKGFAMIANIGQMADKGRGDNAYLYVTKNKPDVEEGESDLITIGPCCNTDYRQGPEKFIEPAPDPIEQSNLVVWYVPQIKNDDREGNKYCWAESYVKDGIYSTRVYPCFSGALWVPIK